MTPDDLRAKLRNPGFLVTFRCRSGAEGRMPQTPVSTYSRRRVPLTCGLVTAIHHSGTSVKIEDDHGIGGWVSVADILVHVDEL